MMNRTTETVAPYPNWVRSAPLKYRYVSIVCDAFAGPPGVVIQTMSKSWSEPMTARKIQNLLVGPSSGSMIRLVICHDEVPSEPTTHHPARAEPEPGTPPHEVGPGRSAAGSDITPERQL